jgi:MinD-like ATPase involved in chromosome partitioning or flagellar assembly
VTDRRVCVLVLAAGARWEAGALEALGEAGIVVVKRCVDLPDLMASSAAGGADVAVVAGDLPHLDADAVTHLLRYDVRTLAVADDPATADRLVRLGVIEVVRPDAPDLVAAVTRVSAHDVVVDPAPGLAPRDLVRPEGRGRVRAVWGPTGAPGRTTVAVGLASALAAAGDSVVLVDADPYGGSVAQHLGVLDESSGLLAVARMANAGTLDDATFLRSCRRVVDRLDVLTGLPRPDRRVEVRPGVLGSVLDTAAGLADVVVDCGFCLEDVDLPQSRDRMTLDVLAAADEVVVVGSAEPTGLARLARGLVELADLVPGTPLRVVVNRMRPSLGWSRPEIVGMVEGYARPQSVHFLPEDREGVDRGLVAGRAVTELGDSSLRNALDEVAVAIRGPGAAAAAHRRRRRFRRAVGA